MSRVLTSAVILACALGGFVLISLILSKDVPMPAWVPVDIHAGSWLELILRLFGHLLLIGPFAGFLSALFSLGADWKGETIFEPGRTAPVTLRIASGVKWTMVIICLGLLAAIPAILLWQEDPLAMWLFVSPLWLSFLYCLVVILTYRATYTDEALLAPTWTLRWRTHQWEALSAIALKPETSEMILTFEDGTRARISTFLEGFEGLARFARIKLQEPQRARTA